MAEKCFNLVCFLGGLMSSAGIFLFLVPLAFGITPMVVMSGSMEPEIPVGSVVYIAQKIPPEEICKEDVISYRMGKEMSVLHRVVTVDRKERTFCTKGDANQGEDPGLVRYTQYEGKEIFSVPYLGYIVWFLRSTMNRIWILAGAAVLAAAEWYRRNAGRRRAV